jgi:hypothetical protein
MFPARNAQKLFIPVDGGYLYRMPSPWIFAPPLRYIVNERQRAGILAVINNPWRGTWLVLSVIAGIIWAVITNLLWSVASGHSDRTGFELITINLIWLMPMYFVAVILFYRQRRRVEQIIAGLR